ncbi:hypothetical protein ASG57_25265 [Bradyrhizobium sp. Leaf396]|nr:hypothetical protein ASG57_25265 [Bradyrhizobium sp. Leaf396]
MRTEELRWRRTKPALSNVADRPRFEPHRSLGINLPRFAAKCELSILAMCALKLPEVRVGFEFARLLDLPPIGVSGAWCCNTGGGDVARGGVGGDAVRRRRLRRRRLTASPRPISNQRRPRNESTAAITTTSPMI